MELHTVWKQSVDSRARFTTEGLKFLQPYSSLREAQATKRKKSVVNLMNVLWKGVSKFTEMWRKKSYLET